MTEGAKPGTETLKGYFRKIRRTAASGMDVREASHRVGDWAGVTAATSPWQLQRVAGAEMRDSGEGHGALGRHDEEILPSFCSLGGPLGVGGLCRGETPLSLLLG